MLLYRKIATFSKIIFIVTLTQTFYIVNTDNFQTKHANIDTE